MTMNDFEEQSRTYAWDWFALHASQRLQLVNFWLVSVASVGMLAKEAERFRSGEDGDEGSSGAPKPQPKGSAPSAFAAFES